MELEPGFKLSEAGPIPEDWEGVRLGDNQPFVTSGSRGWSRYYSDQGDLFVRITNMLRDDIRLDLTDVRFVQPPADDAEAARTALHLNDLLISITADIGIVSLVTADVPLPAFVNQHVAAVRLPPETVDPLYAAYALKTGQAAAWFRAITDAGAKAGINLSTVRQTPLVKPPLPEQLVIAGVLGDVDAWIATAEAEAVKLASVKAAAMDALLTPTTRLPDFKEEWEVAPLIRLARLHKEQIVPANSPKANFTHYSLPAFDELGAPTLEPGAAIGSNKFTVPIGAVLLSKLNPRIARIWPTMGGANAVCSTEFLVLVPNDDADRDFLIQALQGPTFQRQMLNAVTGTTGSHQRAEPATIMQIELAVPSTLAEQRAIAAILTDIDAALAAVRAVVAKARSVRVAAMDALLSGRIRVTLP